MLMIFAIVLGQFSYIYNLGETGCYSYYFDQKNLDIKNITFLFLNSLPHVKYLWESYLERHVRYDFATLYKETT